MKETLPDRIRTMIEDVCAEVGVVLIDVVVRGQARQLVVDIMLDAPAGITHEHCRTVSRALDERLENDEFAGRLRAVDVSSPGAETPVKFLWQLTKHVGRTVRVVHTDGTVIQGTLLRADDLGLDVQPTQQQKESKPPVLLHAGDIAEARMVITF